MASLHVKIGDTIEFAPVGNDSETSASMTAGRVMDIHPSEPELCMVQVSPYEPLRTVNLQHHVCKIVYAVGDTTLLTPQMMGWQIEIADDAQQIEAAIIKRVDLDINCALVAFESGKKEWLDLALSTFKVLVQTPELTNHPDESSGHQKQGDQHDTRIAAGENLIVNPQQDHDHEELNSVDDSDAHPADDTQFEQPVIPPLNVPARTVDSYTASLDNLGPSTYPSKPPPESDVASFDWYSEGGHAEICDPHGGFIEGAILCSKTDTHVQLYNETHQFFEIPMTSQSFKVVIHGLLSLKWIPMGQAIEVYSAMTGGFHQGIVIKAAEVSKLTPIRFANSGAVEWLDLSTQTFKLVFVSEQHAVVDDLRSSYSPSKVPSSPTHKSHHHLHRHHHRAAVAGSTTPLELPFLKIGQRIEIFEAASKQFAKYKVTHVSESTPHEYEFEPQASPSSSSNPSTADSVVIRNLAHLRCRISLHPQMWDEYREILPGHRADVFDKAEKTAVNAKILEVGSTENHHSILVRYKDGTKSWIHPQNAKVRLRLQGEPANARSVQDNHHTSVTEEANSNRITGDKESAPIDNNFSEMWEQPAFPTDSPHESGHRHLNQQQLAPVNKTHLSRNRSDLVNLSSQADDIAAQAQLTHYASTNDIHVERSIEIESIAMMQEIPSVVQPLDFSSLRKLRPAMGTEEAVYSVTPELSVNASHSPRSSGRSRKPDSPSTSGRLPFNIDDVWKEELDPALNQVGYVHNASGVRQTQVPEWLERSNSSTGKLFVVHTPTNTLYSVPSDGSRSSSSGTTQANSSTPGFSSPGNSGGRVVVPIGPIEAVRVYNMLDK